MSFLVSSKKHYERNAVSEAYFVINDILKQPCTLKMVEIPGLAILNLVELQNPISLMIKIKETFFGNRLLTDCLRIIPIQKFVDSKPDSIVESAIKLSQGSFEDKSWKIHVKKRHTRLSSTMIRENIAKVLYQLNDRVDLKSPEIIIRIEIIGKITGISIHSPADIYRNADNPQFIRG